MNNVFTVIFMHLNILILIKRQKNTQQALFCMLQGSESDRIEPGNSMFFAFRTIFY